MKYDQGNPKELREKFWTSLEASPFLMLQCDSDPTSLAPMTAQLDRDADHAIWFFTSRDSHFAAAGAATAVFVSKDHELFARFGGTLVEEQDRARLDKAWSPFVASWYPGGKDDSNLLLLRMDLGNAVIWSGQIGTLATIKTALGMDVTGAISGGKTETPL